MVYSFASISTPRPNSARVDEVTGPIDAIVISFRMGREIRPAKATKFFTVDELVKVITSGHFAGFFIIARNRARDDAGITVS